MKCRSWGRRVLARRPHLKPPAPDPSGLEEARQAVLEAVETHYRVVAQGPEVQRRAAKAEKIHQDNNLGPSIWRVMEGRRA